MTIGIGVLCSTESRRTDAIVMISDSMGSTETDSTDALGKMFTRRDEYGIHGVAAGSLSVASEMFNTIAEQLNHISGPRNHGAIWRSLNVAVNGIRSEKFFWEVLRNEHVIENEIMGRIFQNDPTKIIESWQTYNIGADLLIGTFDDEGAALLYFIGRFYETPGLVHLVQFPGHQAIGTGCQNASSWLNFRSQAINFSVERSVYHAYEASRMAAAAPTVNKQIEITIATKGDSSYFSDRHHYPGRYEVTFEQLEKMYEKHGPQRTDGELPSMRLASQKSEDQQ